tara:strand:+ start:88 stop:921 length:834 start_codon:yes stop_codon:yes gene_type:complete
MSKLQEKIKPSQTIKFNLHKFALFIKKLIIGIFELFVMMVAATATTTAATAGATGDAADCNLEDVPWCSEDFDIEELTTLLFDGHDCRLEPLQPGNSILPAKIIFELEASTERGKLLRACQRAAFVHDGRIWGTLDFLWTIHKEDPCVDFNDVLGVVRGALPRDTRYPAEFIAPLRCAQQTVMGPAGGAMTVANDSLYRFMHCRHEPTRFPEEAYSSPYCAVCHASASDFGIEFACIPCGYALCAACASWSFVSTQNNMETKLNRDPIVAASGRVSF